MSDVDELDRVRFLILEALRTNGAVDKYHGMTISEINDDTEGLLGIRMTIWRKIRKLVEQGYIAKGIMDKRADTYYLLEKGMKIYKEVKQK